MANNKKLSLVLYVISTLIGAISGYFGINVSGLSYPGTDEGTTPSSSLVMKQ